MSDPRSGVPRDRGETIPRLIVKGVHKSFPKGAGHATLFGFLRSLLTREQRAGETLSALEDVTFTVNDGDVVGVVGPNGAGKTTLLKILAGLYRPTSGEVIRNGRPTLLSGLGVGMVQDLSARENVYLYGAICGLEKRRMDDLFGEILEWAELEDFVDTPLRNLSSGMRSRLAFSVTRHVESEVLLLDEAEGAGDQRFKGKVSDYFESRPRSGSAVVISSHSLEFVEEFCNKAMWLRYGEQVAFGETMEVVESYREWAS